MFNYTDSLMLKVVAFYQLPLALVQSICLLLLLEGRGDYGKNVPFVQPRARRLSVQSSDMLD